jgi:N-acetylmuramoyl-L-alanine amidase
MQLRNGSHVNVLETRNGWSRVGVDQWIASWLINTSGGGGSVPQSGLWRVQIGASSSAARAEEIAATARARGFSTYTRHRGGKYLVQVGAYAVRSNADNMVARARAAGFSDAFVRGD